VLQRIRLRAPARGPHVVVEDERHLWVSCKDSRHIVRVSLDDPDDQRVIACGPRPIFVAVHPRTGDVYSGAAGAGVALHRLADPAAAPLPLSPPPPSRPFRLVLSRTESAPLADLLPPHLASEDVTVAHVSGALKFCQLATGEADLHSRTGPYMEWDCAAGDGILRALGLPVRSRATGTPLRYNSPDLRVNGLWVSRV
jgi:3'-phosphoadenosine 5'-phosphosulfate (PAPS) 3'-phosphatase